MNAARSRAATRVLITGFGPFPGVPVNASMPLLAELAARAPRLFPGVHLTIAVIAAEWLAAPQRLNRLLAESRPDVALHFGVSPRARGFELELRARNACSAVPDASGALPPDDKCDAHGAEHLPVSLPVRHIAQRLRRIGIPAFLSRDAGAYLCNYLSWRAIEATQRPGGPALASFIHVPLVARNRTAREGASGITLEQLIDAGEAMLMETVKLVRQKEREVEPAESTARVKI